MKLYGEITGYDLEPCPYCGEPVKMRYYDKNEPFTLSECGYEVRCTSCGIARGTELFVLPEADPRKALGAQENSAYVWNKFCRRRKKKYESQNM